MGVKLAATNQKAITVGVYMAALVPSPFPSWEKYIEK